MANTHTKEELDSQKIVLILYEEENVVGLKIVSKDTYSYRPPFHGYWDMLDEMDPEWRKKNMDSYNKMSKVSCKESVEIAFETRNPYDLAAAKTKICDASRAGHKVDEAIRHLAKAEIDENFFSDKKSWSLFFRLTD